MAKIFRIGRRRLNLDFVISFYVETSDLVTNFWSDDTQGGRGIFIDMFPRDRIDVSETEAKAAGWADIDALAADLEVALGAD